MADTSAAGRFNCVCEALPKLISFVKDIAAVFAFPKQPALEGDSRKVQGEIAQWKCDQEKQTKMALETAQPHIVEVSELISTALEVLDAANPPFHQEASDTLNQAQTLLAQFRQEIERGRNPQHLEYAITRNVNGLRGFASRLAKLLAGSREAGSEDETAYRPASEFMREPHGTIKAINKVLADNPWIRSKKPSKQRLLIHAGDWMKYVASLPTAPDPLDSTAAVVDAVVEVENRKKAIQQGS